MESAKQRILFLVTTTDWGGVQFFISRLAVAAKTAGYDVLVAAGTEGHTETDTMSLKEQCLKNAIAFQELHAMRRDISLCHDLSALRELRRLLRTYRPDIVHLNSSKMGVLGSIAARLERVPRIIYRIGGWSFLEDQSSWKRWLYRAAEKQTASCKDVIVTVHPGDEKLARQSRILPREELLTIANGIDLERFDREQLSREHARERLGLNAEDFVIGTVANFYAPKNLPAYLETIADLKELPPSVRFVILGDGPERGPIERRLHDLHLEDRVSLLGRRPDASCLLKAFDVFALPSSKEGMPWALLEAMAAGLACLATDVGACRWMLGPDAGLIVPSHDPQALAAAIHTLLHDPALRLRLGTKARLAVEQRFRWQDTLQKNLDLFSSRPPGGR